MVVGKKLDTLLNENYAGNTISTTFSQYDSAEKIIDKFISNKKKIDSKKPQENKPETTLLSQPIKDNPFNFPKLDIPKTTKDVPVNQIVDPSGMGGMFNEVNQKKEEAKKLIDNISSEEINLSFLLNILDGVLETPGRILIMSSNYPERLDKALIRPGRIDLMIEFTKCSDKTIKEMLSSFFDIKPVVLSVYRFPEYQYTPAEVNQIMFQNIHNCDDAIRILLEKKI
jgi:SpoVK/Ycf46/Vps4 family AAA+-type ATPase